MEALLLLRWRDPDVRGALFVLVLVFVLAVVVTRRMRFMRCPNHVLGERLRWGIIAVGIGMPSFVLGIAVVRTWFFDVVWMDHLFDQAGFMVVVAMALIAIAVFVLLTLLVDRVFLMIHPAYRDYFRNERSVRDR